MLSALLNRPLTIITRTDGDETDEFGNVILAETYTAVLGELQQQRRSEPDEEGERSDSTWLLILPAGTEITTSSAIVCDGQVYELVGAPWLTRNPRTQTVSHIEATVRRTAGADDEAGS